MSGRRTAEFLLRLDGLIFMAEEKRQRAKAAGAEVWLIASYDTLVRSKSKGLEGHRESG